MNALMPFYSRFMCGVLRAFSVETLPCLDIFDLTICGMGLFVRPISREVGDNESNAFRVIGGIMRRSAKAAHYSKKQLVRRLEQSIAKRTTIDASPEGLPIGRPPPYVRVRRGACAGDRLGRGCSRDGR